MSKLFATLFLLALGFAVGSAYEHRRHAPPDQEQLVGPGLIREPMGVAEPVTCNGITVETLADAPWNQGPPPAKYKTLHSLTGGHGLH